MIKLRVEMRHASFNIFELLRFLQIDLLLKGYDTIAIHLYFAAHLYQLVNKN